MMATVVLSAGPSGTGPLIRAAQNSRGIAVVERDIGIDGTIGHCALNSDSANCTQDDIRRLVEEGVYA
jgi:hypothetical protein